MAAVALVRRLILSGAIFVLPFQYMVHTQQQSDPQPEVRKPANGSRGTPAWPMPPRMRFCDPAHCGTLTRRNGRYEAIYDDGPMTSFYAIGATPPDMVLYRVDQDGRTATLKGRVSAQGNRLRDGVITWDNGESCAFNLAWGSAIETVIRPPAPQKER
jgi:hypothetical protein